MLFTIKYFSEIIRYNLFFIFIAGIDHEMLIIKPKKVVTIKRGSSQLIWHPLTKGWIYHQVQELCGIGK